MELNENATQARTSVYCARVGSLTTYTRHPSRQHTSAVAVQPRPDGTVEVQVPVGSLAARHLVSRPVATLLVAPAACQPVLVHGAARRLRPSGSGSVLTFHLDVATVRVGAARLAVDEQAYARAAPDPLRHDAPAVLAHLNTGHAQALAGCLRARGADVGFVHATGLDAGGLTVLVTNGRGVDIVRLRFPSRVASLDELPVSLSAVLQPGHICPCVRRGGTGAADNAPAAGQ